MKLMLDTWSRGMTDEYPVKMDVDIAVDCPESGGFMVGRLDRNLMVMGLDLKLGEQPRLGKMSRVISIINLTPEEGRELIEVLEIAVKAMLDD